MLGVYSLRKQIVSCVHDLDTMSTAALRARLIVVDAVLNIEMKVYSMHDQSLQVC